MRVLTSLLVSVSQNDVGICGNESVTLERAKGCAEALALLKKSHFDLAIVEFCDEASFANFSRDAKLLDPTVHIVAALPNQFRQLATMLLANGADDVIQSPIDPIEFAVLLKRTFAHLADRDEMRFRRAQSNALSTEFIGRSEQTLAIFKKLDEISRSTDPVLISGGPGTGKKLLAWSLHLRSMRRGGAYVVVNCSSYPGAMLEYELFGSSRRNITGTHAGALTVGEGGTVVLQNVDAMSLPIQQRLLKVLESNGSVNVRIVCLTLKDLDREAEQGRFERALLTKLTQRHIPLPSLRERSGDVVLIGEYFYRRYCAELGANTALPEAGFWEALSAHAWPGNVNELSNTMYRAALLCMENKTVQLSSVQDQSATSRTNGSMPVRGMEAPLAAAPKAAAQDEAVFKIGVPLETVELEMIRRTVELTKGNRTQAAKVLGISVRSLYNKMIEVDRLASTHGQAATQRAASETESTRVLAEAQCV